MAKTIERAGDVVYLPGDNIQDMQGGCDIAVMYGWREILTPAMIEQYPMGVVNIHNAMLPFGRGAHPNFWAWFENNDHGVTIHRVDEGIDTGPVLAQRNVIFELRHNHTLSSSYAVLHDAAVGLFDQEWSNIRTGIRGTPQRGIGSTHKKKDIEPWWPLLSAGWDTPVREVMELGRSNRYGSAINKMDAVGG